MGELKFPAWNADEYIVPMVGHGERWHGTLHEYVHTIDICLLCIVRNQGHSKDW